MVDMLKYDRIFVRIAIPEMFVPPHAYSVAAPAPCLPDVQSCQRPAHSSCTATLALKCFSHHWRFLRGNRRPMDSLHGNIDLLMSSFMVNNACEHTFESSVDMKLM